MATLALGFCKLRRANRAFVCERGRTAAEHLQRLG
jgi:hypothetical protein